MPSVRLALAIFAVGSTVLAAVAFWAYRSALDYCKGSYEVRSGGDGLSCLEPQHWFTINVGILGVLLLELALVVVVGAAVVHARRKGDAPSLGTSA